MTTDHVREARAACERQFSFLVTEFGYRKVRSRLESNGFELRYLGPTLGVVVQWFPRDPFTVLLARLVNGDFPPAYAAGSGDTAVNYFDLLDVIALGSGVPPLEGFRQQYSLPNDETAALMAQGLREYGSDLLRGDLSVIPRLEQRVNDRRRGYNSEPQNRIRGE
jgi:hypothetical protein